MTLFLLYIKGDFKMNLQELINKGWELASRREDNEAIQVFDRVLHLGGNHHSVHYARAMVFHSAKRFEEGVESAQVAIRLNREYPFSYLVLGHCFEAVGKAEEAKVNYIEGLMRYVENPTKEGKAAAKQAGSRLLQLAPDDAAVKSILERVRNAIGEKRREIGDFFSAVDFMQLGPDDGTLDTFEDYRFSMDGLDGL